MRLLILALAFVSGFSSARDIEGLWVGFYEYTLNDQPTRVEFSLILESNGNKVVGKIMESNTFGDNKNIALFANVNGVLNNQTVKFYKTYDGASGANHSVLYEFHFANEHRVARGTWTIGEANSGLATMLKVEF
jgi:hypothetical protein